MTATEHTISELPVAFTIAEAARYLRISNSHIYRLIRAGDLRVARLGGRTLVRRVDADALLSRAAGAA